MRTCAGNPAARLWRSRRSADDMNGGTIVTSASLPGLESGQGVEHGSHHRIRIGPAARHRHDQLGAGLGTVRVRSADTLRIAREGGSAEITAIPDLPGHAFREAVLIGEVEHVPAPVHEHQVVEALYGFVRTFHLPSASDDVGRIDDVPEPEDQSRLRNDPSERLERWPELSHRPVRHVVDEQDVGPEVQRDAADELLPQRADVLEAEGEVDGPPIAGPYFLDRGQLHVVVVRRRPEEIAERRILDRQDDRVGLELYELGCNRSRAAHVSEAEPVLGIDHQPYPLRIGAVRVHPRTHRARGSAAARLGDGCPAGIARPVAHGSPRYFDLSSTNRLPIQPCSSS